MRVQSQPGLHSKFQGSLELEILTLKTNYLFLMLFNNLEYLCLQCIHLLKEKELQWEQGLSLTLFTGFCDSIPYTEQRCPVLVNGEMLTQSNCSLMVGETRGKGDRGNCDWDVK